MNTIFQTVFTRVGDNARESLIENMMITFREGAPADIEAFCFIHRHGEMNGEVSAGSTLRLADAEYPITAVGNVATQNLRELGHITIRFDGAAQAEFPGTIHVEGATPKDIPVGSTLTILA
ncbi:PTS glucitol/sorbitol transporter subunit IIA [Brenneria roseae subsp. roseae]|uniref:PTS glucitol/sorbitol transporter subunit IIA n=1 Tax=Brenneria roseae TaxID=1509241 RepID=UPI000D611983|nr:PTS glucitol/sorbitol transporter subunit IIA [Brenneria roseae]PWC19944.1 PTS glucitol/sorbitol transporter subunit IIA [Brenneria roseae subsp. roseae]